MASLWAVACYFNPARFAIAYENYKRFRSALGAPLLVVELSRDGSFELRDDDADIVVRAQSASVLWHKENLLNVGIRHLPAECTQVCWIDADVIASDADWPAKTSALLEQCQLVQPFSRVWRLAKDQTLDEAIARRNEPPQIGVKNGHFETGAAAAVLAHGPAALEDIGSTGFMWAAPRGLIQQLTLFDRMIVGAGDAILAKAAFGLRHEPLDPYPRLAAAAERWAKPFHDAVGPKVGYLDQPIYHLWHGELRDRKYRQRYAILEGYDPDADVGYDSHGILQWTTDKSDLHRNMEAYFKDRKEDR